MGRALQLVVVGLVDVEEVHLLRPRRRVAGVERIDAVDVDDFDHALRVLRLELRRDVIDGDGAVAVAEQE